jgi:hypothetical protein
VRSCATQDSVGRRVQGRIDRAVWCETPILKTLELPSGCQPVYQSRPGIALRCCWKLL